jgi:hypothetical protein
MSDEPAAAPPITQSDSGSSVPAGSGGASAGSSSSEISAAPITVEDEIIAQGAAAVPLPFADVQTSDWYYGDIAYVYARNLFGGTTPTAFSPQTPVTRGMLVTVIGRMAGANVSGYANVSTFADVLAGQYYAPYVQWAQSNAIVNGIGGSSFAPEGFVSRQDLAVILMNYARFTGKSLPVKQAYNGFADAQDIAGYAQAAVQALYQAGVINGKPGNVFDPKGVATRAEMAAILRRFIELT